MKLWISETGSSAAQDSNPEEITTNEATPTLKLLPREFPEHNARKKNPSEAW